MCTSVAFLVWTEKVKELSHFTIDAAIDFLLSISISVRGGKADGKVENRSGLKLSHLESSGVNRQTIIVSGSKMNR